MNKITYFVIMALMGSLLFIQGCAKKPDQELQQAEQAMQKAKAAEAPQWASDTYKKAENKLAEGKKLINDRRYKVAAEALVECANLANKAASEAEAAKQKAAEEQARKAAEEAAKQKAEEEEKSRDYTVRRGDCLWFIAKRTYGDPYQWSKIYRGNRGAIRNPDLIYPNQVIALP